VIIFPLVLIGLVGCQTYYIPIESFKEQFKGIDSTKLQTVQTQGPAGYYGEYLANPIENIYCIDKDDNPVTLQNSPTIEIRFTDKNNKKTIFYLDRMYLQDTLIIGDRSRFVGARKEISINDVKLIEVQDGKKNFQYVNRVE